MGAVPHPHRARGGAIITRIVETVTIRQDLDPYLPLAGLASYSGLSVRTLRSLLRHPTHPLPHYRIGALGASQAGRNGRRVRGTKILVRRSEFDRWMEVWRQREQEPPQDLDGILDQAVASLKRR